MSIIDVIHEMQPDLTKKQRSIAAYLLEYPDEASYLSLKQLSIRVKASEVSVLRFCKALGYDSYINMKAALQAHTKEALRAPFPIAFNDVLTQKPNGAPDKLLAQICTDEQNNIAEMINKLDFSMLIKCVRNLLGAQRVIIFAHDKSILFANYLAYRLNFLRIKTTSAQLGDSDTVSTTLANLEENDSVVLFSFPPYHEPTRNVANYCSYKNIPILTITSSQDSPAVVEGSSVFLCPSGARYFFNSQAATVSFINILASCTAIEMGPRFDEILADEQDIIDFLRNGKKGASHDDGK